MPEVLKTRFDSGESVPVIANINVIGGRLAKLVPGGDGRHGRSRVTHTNARTDRVYGVIEQDRPAGKNATVNRESTYMYLEANGNIGENDFVVPAATANVTDVAAGRVEALGASPGPQDNVIGQALHAATLGEKVLCAVEFRLTK
jgi:hypothetical protein